MKRSRTLVANVATLVPLLGAVLLGTCWAQAQAPKKLPYIYTQWKNFTVADGLPSDHIFSVKADGDRVWIGTEAGLAMYDKKSGKMKSWTVKDGLPWPAITGIDVDKSTGDVWLALFGGGIARFSGGRFDHFHQMNSGLVNDVVYGITVEHDNIWAATTAGSSRFNKVSGEWTIFTEKNAPMEEIWNYNVSYNGKGTVYLAVWGSGVLEYKIADGSWKEYLDPDGEMEIDLYRDDGIVHVITTAVAPAGDGFFVSTYFGASRYDGRHWRGYYNQDSGVPSDFMNSVKARSTDEAWFSTDKGLGVLTDFDSNTWITYRMDPKTHHGKATVYKDRDVLEEVETETGIPHNYIIYTELDGNEVWVGTSKGLAWGKGEGYYPGLRERGAVKGNLASAPPAAASLALGAKGGR
jgi:ligand-binding sensor domain-containing protein